MYESPRIGDLAEAMDPSVVCPCGRGLPRIGRIEGRVQAIILGSNGAFIPGTFFAHLFKEYDQAIKQYQIIQEREGEIRCLIVKGDFFTEECLKEILAALKHFLGHTMSIRVEFPDSIPLGPTGKRQGSISRLPLDFQKVHGKMVGLNSRG